MDEQGERNSASNNPLSPEMQAILREALAMKGYDPDAALRAIVQLAMERPALVGELGEMLLGSFQVAVADVMSRPERGPSQHIPNERTAGAGNED